MPKFKDITGERYGRLVVKGLTGAKKYNKYLWLCECDCGNTTELIGRALQSGNTRSCGCLHLEAARTHGLTDTPEYRVWSSMFTRCYNEKSDNYKDYGARGVTVCDRWRESFENFLADMGPRPAGMSLDRIDVNGNYEPSNCRWATGVEQMNNTRNNRRVTANGVTKTLMQWCRERALPYDRVWHRLHSGWSPEKALELT